MLIRRICRLEMHRKGRIVADGVELTGDVPQADKARRGRHGAAELQPVSAFRRARQALHRPVWVKKIAQAEAGEMVGTDLEPVPIRELVTLLEPLNDAVTVRRTEELRQKRVATIDNIDDEAAHLGIAEAGQVSPMDLTVG
jgi:hypothetical protein